MAIDYAERFGHLEVANILEGSKVQHLYSNVNVLFRTHKALQT